MRRDASRVDERIARLKQHAPLDAQAARAYLAAAQAESAALHPERALALASRGAALARRLYFAGDAREKASKLSAPDGAFAAVKERWERIAEKIDGLIPTKMTLSPSRNMLS